MIAPKADLSASLNMQFNVALDTPLAEFNPVVTSITCDDVKQSAAYSHATWINTHTVVPKSGGVALLCHAYGSVNCCA